MFKTISLHFDLTSKITMCRNYFKKSTIFMPNSRRKFIRAIFGGSHFAKLSSFKVFCTLMSTLVTSWVNRSNLKCFLYSKKRFKSAFT